MTQRVCEKLAFFFGIKWMWHTRCTNNSHKNLTYSRIPYFSVALPTTTPQLLPACQGRVKQWETFSLIFKLYSKHLPLLHNAKLNFATAGLQSTTNPAQPNPLLFTSVLPPLKNNLRSLLVHKGGERNYLIPAPAVVNSTDSRRRRSSGHNKSPQQKTRHRDCPLLHSSPRGLTSNGINHLLWIFNATFRANQIEIRAWLGIGIHSSDQPTTHVTFYLIRYPQNTSILETHLPGAAAAGHSPFVKL